KFKAEAKNPVNSFLERIYEPVIRKVLKWRKTTLAVNIIALIIAIPLLRSMGTEFMPPLDEQSILFMPVTLPDVSNTEIKRIMQVQDKIIKTVPEVDKVLGKAGRANTATDNSPLSMIETIIMLKPKSEWRAGITKEDIIQELDRKLQIPGVVNGWTQPIINRINMLATGIRTDVGIKVFGENLDTIAAVSERIKSRLAGTPGITDLFVEPITGGKYLSVNLRREELYRYGLSADDVNMVIESALGGVTASTAIEGRKRFPITVRMSEDFRGSIDAIGRIPLMSPEYGNIPLSAVADIVLEDGPPMISSENAILRGAVMFNVRGRDLGNTVEEAMKVIKEEKGI